VTEKQEDDKNINNEEVENSFEVKKHKFDYYVMKEQNYYVMNSNINFYEIKFYNQKNEKSDINFVVTHTVMKQCHEYY